jgi:DNA polymerase
MQIITLDFETYYDSKFSLTKLTTMDYVRDPMFKVWGVGIKIDDEPTEWYGEDEVLDAINSIEWADCALLCHNTPFDGYILTQYYKVTPKYYYDTASMMRGMFPGQSASLKDSAVRMFPNDESMRKGEELVMAKGMYDLDEDTEEAIAGYCIQDVDLTYAIFHKALETFPEIELDVIDLTCRMFCEPILEIDRERLAAYHEQEFVNAEETIKASGIDKKVLSSNLQFADYIKNELKLNPPMKRSPTTGKSIPALGKNDAGWKQLCDMYPEHSKIWQAREAVKSRLTETRAKRFLDAADPITNKIPAPLRYYAAHTGRFGGTEKLNMQNMPRTGELRKCLMAPKGHLIYVADLSNIEARMLAWVAGEHELLEQFARGDDIYSNFASVIYGRTINKKTDPTERFVGKTAVLGLGYGMGAQKFQATLKSGAMGPAMEFTLDEAFRNTYNNISLLWKRLENLLISSFNMNNWGTPYKDGVLKVIQNGFIMPNGMAIRYEGLHMHANRLTYYSRGKPEQTYGGRITENIIQALSRIVITESMLRLETSIPNGRVALTVHDEIIIVAPDTQPDATMDQIIDDLCQPPSWALDLPLAAEGGYDTVYSK